MYMSKKTKCVHEHVSEYEHEQGDSVCTWARRLSVYMSMSVSMYMSKDTKCVDEQVTEYVHEQGD